jgi:Xaa-Pro aminopeptidase
MAESPEVLLQRLERVREAMRNYKKVNGQNIDGLVLTHRETSKVDIAYLTGFTGSYSACVLTQNAQIFISDGRYAIQAKQEVCEGWDVRITKPGQPAHFLITEAVKELGVCNLGFLASQEDVAFYRWMRKNIKPCRFLPMKNVLGEVRHIKDSTEIVAIRRAIADIEDVLSYIYTLVRPGVSDRELARELRIALLRKDIDISFEPIILSGAHSAIIHGVPFKLPDKKIAAGDIIQFDVGCMRGAYVSDISRVATCGKASNEQWKMYEAVRRAHDESLKLYKSGVLVKKAAQKAYDVLESMGFSKFGHSLGHGLGREVHEGIGVNPRSKQRFAVGQVVTNEPGIYIEGYGGMRIERDILITPDGPEPMDTLSIDLREISV